ncbi:hypothetical protein F5X97DRAFT_324993 [Nemania serpens]|nr:hypothetical protein F5X97DRAFT_324993 [Nemania serpens]
MAQPYICLGNGKWSGRLADVQLRWKLNASTWMIRHAQELEENGSVLKALSEHLLCRLARRLGCDRAIIKSTPYELPNLNPSSNSDRAPPSLQMSGLVFLSHRKWFRHVRIYIDPTSTPSMKQQEPEAIGEAVYVSNRGHRALDLQLSWGMGVDEWVGPVIGDYASSSSSGSHLPSDTAPSSTDEVPATSPSPNCAKPMTHPHCMNPEAAAFFPGSAIDEEHKTETENYPSPSHIGGGSSMIQYSGNMSSNQFHGIHVNVNPMAGIPFAHDTTGSVWDPYTQRWGYSAYNMQPWGLGVPFNNFQTYNAWGPPYF